mgnify:CR=1 FL=1
MPARLWREPLNNKTYASFKKCHSEASGEESSLQACILYGRSLDRLGMTFFKCLDSGSSLPRMVGTKRNDKTNYYFSSIPTFGR